MRCNTTIYIQKHKLQSEINRICFKFENSEMKRGESLTRIAIMHMVVLCGEVGWLN